MRPTPACYLRWAPRLFDKFVWHVCFVLAAHISDAKNEATPCGLFKQTWERYDWLSTSFSRNKEYWGTLLFVQRNLFTPILYKSVGCTSRYIIAIKMNN